MAQMEEDNRHVVSHVTGPGSRPSSRWSCWEIFIVEYMDARVAAKSARARRTAKLHVLPSRSRAQSLSLIEDDEGAARVFERPDVGYLSSGLMNLNVRAATRPPSTSATR
jgi:hypothetical protein